MQWNIAAYANGVVADTVAVTIDGWGTANNNFLKVYTPVSTNEVGVSQRHSGKWENSKYIVNSSNVYNTLTIYSSNVVIDGLQMLRSNNDVGSYYGVYIYPVASGNFVGNENIVLKNNIVSFIGSTTSSTGIGSSHPSGVYVYNNIVYGFKNTGILFPNSGLSHKQNYIYNNNVFGSLIGFDFSYTGTPKLLAKNNISQNCIDGYYGSVDENSDFNISDIVGDAPNATLATTSKTVQFVDPANKDFHLAQTDTAARGAGANLTNDPYSPITTDIDGQLRNATGTGWDIGADEGTVEFSPTVMQSGGDYSTLSSWEAGVQTDLTASTTRVFSHGGITGIIPDNATVVGQTSHATGTVVHVTASSSQILLENIAGTFLAGETVQVSAGNSVVLSDNGNPASAVAKIDGEWTVADTADVVITGWETGFDNYIRIYTTSASRHDARWSDNKYRLKITGWAPVLSVNENYAEVDGLQLSRDYANGTDPTINIGSGGYVNYVIKNNLLTRSGGFGNGISLSGTQNGISIIANNIVYGNHAYCIAGRWLSVNATVYYINNTVSGCRDYGFSNVENTGIAYSNISLNAGTSFSPLSDLSSNNISSDATAPGTDSKTNTTVRFVDAANGDFHLAEDDTAAKNAGTSAVLSAGASASLGAGSSLMYDIDGQPRYDVGWDIGADEAATPIYRSVGLHANDLSEGGKTVTISVATNTASALFSADLPANVGVGDAIQYGNPLTLAFITGRTSSSTYSVQSATGTAPVATTSASVAVYRAHQYLQDWENQVLGDVNQSINAGVQPQVLVNQNLVASNTVMMVPCYASSTADAGVSIYGWTTSTSTYVNVYTPYSEAEVGISQRHVGIWDDEKYRIISDSWATVSFGVENIILDGLQVFSNPYNDYPRVVNIDTNATSSINIIKNSLFEVDFSSVGASGGVIDSGNNGFLGKIYIFNNVIKGASSPNANSRAIQLRSHQNYVYNNTISNGNVGIVKSTGGIGYAQNNVLFNNNDDFAGAFALLDHNASDDGDGTNAISLGSSTAIWKATFTDYENGDFSIRNMASPLYNAGTPIISVTSDILGTPRPYYEAYDIGAFEFKEIKPEFRFSPGGNFKFEGDFKFE
jgi:hypothetical protein